MSINGPSAKYDRQQEEHNKYEEQHFCNACGTCSNTPKAKNGCNEGNDKKGN